MITPPPLKTMRRGLLLFRAVVAGLFVSTRVVRFPSNYNKEIHLFDLHNEHVQVSHPSHDTRVNWLAALVPVSLSLLLCMPTTLPFESKAQRPVAWVDAVFSFIWLYVLLFVAVPHTCEFGTDSKPMHFDTYPSLALYMAMLGPTIANIVVSAVYVYNLKFAENSKLH